MKKIRSVLLAGVLFLSFQAWVQAHPWGGLVVDDSQNIYFSYTCPLVGDDHYACIWRLRSDGSLEQVISSSRSPSDFIVGRTLNRTIVAAERTGQAPNYRNRVYKIDEQNQPLLYPSDSYAKELHLQSYSFTDEASLFFAHRGELFELRPDKQIHSVDLGRSFKYIDIVRLNHKGELFLVADNSLVKVSSEETFLIAKDIKQTDPEGLPFQGANILFDMCIDENDVAYLAYFSNREILRIDTAGKKSSVLKAEHPWSPSGVDCFNGDIFVLESTIGGDQWWKFWGAAKPDLMPRVRKLSSDGKISTLYQYQPEKLERIEKTSTSTRQ